jgi:3-deoxy-D-manno-octulosonic-acid transferase
LGFIAGLPILLFLVITSVKRRKTFFHRLGLISPCPQTSKTRLKQILHKPVWVHALSVGEVISALPLICELRGGSEKVDIVLSVSTHSGFETAKQILEKQVSALFYFPYDLLFSVKNVMRLINPRLLIIIESDIWPNILVTMKKHRIPVICVNARLSDRSYAAYRHFPFLAKSMFTRLTCLFTQSSEDTRRFQQLGVPPEQLVTTANIKFDQDAPAMSSSAAQHLRHSLSISASQPMWIAGSTHDGEESMICAAFVEIKKRYPDLVLIIAPRDPDRARTVRSIFAAAGFAALFITQTQNPASGRRRDVVVVDVIGKLRTLYAIADVALIGGSLLSIPGIGGHNPLEAAAYSKPVIFGPYMENFKEISSLLIRSGGAIQVIDVKNLFDTVTRLIANKEQAGHIGKQAFAVFRQNKGALKKTMKIITPYL